MKQSGPAPGRPKQGQLSRGAAPAPSERLRAREWLAQDCRLASRQAEKARSGKPGGQK